LGWPFFIGENEMRDLKGRLNQREGKIVRWTPG
jgi:hypothetical protein